MPDMPTTIRSPVTSPDVRPSPSPHVTTPADLDRMLHAWENRFTGGRSPSAVSLAFRDWAAHAANAPFQTAELACAALAQWLRLMRIAMGGEKAIACRHPRRGGGRQRPDALHARCRGAMQDG